jgi:hypothetical protein
MTILNAMRAAVALALTKVAADRAGAQVALYRELLPDQKQRHGGYDPYYRPARTDALVSHELRRAFRWLKNNGARLHVDSRTGAKGVLSKSKPPAHIREMIANNWDLLCS